MNVKIRQRRGAIVGHPQAARVVPSAPKPKRWVRTHAARPVPPSYAAADRLPAITPVVGDSIVYLCTGAAPEDRPAGGADILTPECALERIREGRTVWYETFSEE
jgi:hypothetical protein